MKAFLAIFKQTIRSAMRSKVFLVLFALILIVVIGLPLTIKGDNTPAGLVQISLTYSLNIAIALISASTLWLGCSLLASDIESYNVHLVLVKPCPRWVLWLGKWLGIVAMHTAILVVSMFVIYGLTMYRLAAAERSGQFSAEQMEKLRQETLVARRKFYPAPVDLRAQVEKTYEERVRNGSLKPGEDAESIRTLKKAIQTELMQGIMKNISVPPGETHEWNYRGVTVPKGGTPIFLRFRISAGDIAETSQKRLPIDWTFAVFTDKDGKALPAPAPGSYKDAHGQPFHMPGGTWQELATLQPGAAVGPGTFNFPAQVIVNTADGNLARLTFANLSKPEEDPEWKRPAEAGKALTEEQQRENNSLKQKYTAIFQVVDGPLLMCRVASFFDNFLRTVLMAVIQIVFLAALGCTVGAIFSTPVAIFVAVSYIVIGMIVPAAVNAPLRNDDGSYIYSNNLNRAIHYLSRGVQAIVVTVDDLDCTSQLASGELVEWAEVGGALLKVLVLRTGLIALLGIWLLQNRELGLVVRKIG